MFSILWPSMLVGTGLVIASTGAGLGVGSFQTLSIVRWVDGWIALVVAPMLRSHSWLIRFLIIFANNTAILAIVLAAGFWTPAAYCAIVAVGVMLGIGLKVLSGKTEGVFANEQDELPASDWRMLVGFALNMLEPPAIIFTVGLSVGLHRLPQGTEQAWQAFFEWTVPALAFAAAGESLWIGARHQRMDNGGQEKPHTSDSDTP